MTGLKGQGKPAQGKRSAALGTARHCVARPEGARVRRRHVRIFPRPFRADSSFAGPTQGGGRFRSLALGYSPLPRWGKRVAQTDAARPTLPNAVTATETLRSATIDAQVYDLYGLTEDEIKLVEGGQ